MVTVKYVPKSGHSADLLLPYISNSVALHNVLSPNMLDRPEDAQLIWSTSENAVFKVNSCSQTAWVTISIQYTLIDGASH